MKRFIFGSGGFAKEVFFLLKEVYKEEVAFRGFIDIGDKNEKIRIGQNRYEIIDESVLELSLDKYIDDVELYIGIASPEIIKKITFKYNKFKFPNLIHHSFIGHTESISMGVGNIITAGCIFTCCISIGSFNIFNTNTVVGHDSVIGSNNVFLPRTQISGKVQIGDNNVFGMNSSVLQGKMIGNANKLGAYSLIVKNIKDNGNYFGIPATKFEF